MSRTGLMMGAVLVMLAACGEGERDSATTATQELMTAGTEQAAATEEAMATGIDRVGGDRVLVIAHRGASGERPEHTAAAYRLAIEQGADFIEPDLVPTRDGVLIARHENELSDSTDVADRPEFADRRTTKTVDGAEVTGWFSEDFSFAEIRQLRARERIPLLRPGSASHDGSEGILSLAEIIAIAREADAEGRRVGVYPEIKHPTYFAHEGRHLDGSPIGQSLPKLLVDTLVAEGFTDPDRVYIQSFELAGLVELAEALLPEAGIELPLVVLFGRLQHDGEPEAFDLPRDIRFHAGHGDDLDALYPGLAKRIEGGLTTQTTYGDLAAPAVLDWLAKRMQGIGPWKDAILVREPVSPAPVNPLAPRSRLTGAVHPLIADARSAGLAVHPYTLRTEGPVRVLDEDGDTVSMREETRRLLELGATGFFTDHPGETLADLEALDAR